MHLNKYLWGAAPSDWWWLNTQSAIEQPAEECKNKYWKEMNKQTREEAIWELLTWTVPHSAEKLLVCYWRHSLPYSMIISFFPLCLLWAGSYTFYIQVHCRLLFVIKFARWKWSVRDEQRRWEEGKMSGDNYYLQTRHISDEEVQFVFCLLQLMDRFHTDCWCNQNTCQNKVILVCQQFCSALWLSWCRSLTFIPDSQDTAATFYLKFLVCW